MADMILAVDISRGATPNLDLQDPANGYSIVSLGPGATSWRRETVKSPWVHGETLVGAVMDAQVAPLTVRVFAATAATKATRLDAMLDAFSQFEYALAVVINGVVYNWICQPADWSIGDSGEFSKYHEMAHISEVALSIPRNPVPSVGII